MSAVKFHHHGRFALAGGTLPDAITAYQTFGDPKNPCIVFGTCYGGRLDGTGPLGNMWLIGENLPLDPRKYFIVNFASFSNGESSSPSNTPPPYNGPYFPKVTYEDNVHAQYAVLTKELGVSKVFCAMGVSMGGQLAYHWAALYPDFVDRFVSICSAARTSMHCSTVIESVKFAMTSAKDFNDGNYTSHARLAVGAAQRILQSWAYTHQFFRERLYLRGRMYTDLKDFLRAEGDGGWLNWDANDMLTLIDTWQSGDISKTSRVNVLEQGELESTLAGIKAKALVMPSKEDMLFPITDSELEVQAMKNTKAKLAVIPSQLGHGAAGGFSPPDTEFIVTQLNEFFAST
ncbi:hypothetical protein NM688_g1236 [Phlebia brevispora]|uniref:Uncharacterized protein n=1 Tax=Phlebia brevispora TaxID=194682 RepID=A0ACC1TC16_9APHY|nr:hypothetical protein NM688_g1236 [Phlebia brevispora]